MGRTYLNKADYQSAVDYSKGVISRRRSTPSYALYNINLFDGLRGVGDLEGMENLLETMVTEYPKRIPEWTGTEASWAEQTLGTATFWLGFVRYALGDVDGALAYFRKSERDLESAAAEALKAGRKPHQVLDIYLRFRTREYLLILNEFHGKVPAVDFNLGDQWVTEEKLTLKESRGDVVVAVFREPGDLKSRTFLQDIDRMVRERRGEGLRGIVLSYLMGKLSPEKETELMEGMRADLHRLGVGLPAGYDPDKEKQSIFQAVHANFGTATCVVFNRRGELAWYLQDPQDMDRQLSRKVIERLLDE